MALPTIIDAVETLPAFTRLTNTIPGAGQRVTVGGLHGSSAAAMIAALARKMERRFFVIVAENVGDAERWLADLEALDGGAAVAFYPPRESFGEAEPHAEVAGERVETLERAARGDVRVLITTARAIMERTQLPAILQYGRLELKKGDVRKLGELAEHLESIGFERADMVEDVGQYSVRGGIFDVYGFGMANPVRMEFWGDEISELRHFDLTTQRSTRDAEVALILPADGVAAKRASGRKRDIKAAKRAGDRVPITDLWASDTLVIVPSESHAEPEMRRTWDEAQHHLLLAMRRGEDVPNRDELYVAPATATRTLNSFATIALGGEGDPDVGFPFRAPETINRDLKLLNRIVRDGVPTLILCDNAGQIERLEELLTQGPRDSMPAGLVLGVLTGGFMLPPRGTDPGLRIMTDHEIFRRERRIRRARKYVTGGGIDTLGAITPGDYVVHLEHGIGIYRGIEQLFVKEATVEVAVIEYEGGDRLNVPLYKVDQIERYRSASDVGEDVPPPRLHKLGGRRWGQQRDKTRSAIQEMTVELLDLYARRSVATRTPALPDSTWQRQLESSFLFEDTNDQRKATVDVKNDMERPRPMDRLLVGDVGYGKTEIAVRAAFKAVQSGRQVAVLVPTTILADQHARTFGDRFADFPIIVKVMSRFQTQKEQLETLKEVAAKKVDVVIGTHRLLSPDVAFADLGLIIIDEEHRFGVKHKERLKQLRLETDVLTLTATPIPRTLHQSLAGLRDMTLMQTPPRDRSPVLTYVEPWDDALIDEGISRELDRGGQVFFVHNRIETIDAIAQHIGRMIPRARIAVGHGQMRERELEAVMRRFVEGEVDVLVSTLIVESGLDVPNANTMFVNRADMFGLAQLYQLRGRVGRSHRRAYCYLLAADSMDDDSERRLKILEHHTELGSGYRIALKDMELRGAGNLLGPEQSGFVHAVGFDLYLRMLEETVQRVMNGGEGPKLQPADVSLDVAAYIPDEYMPSQDAKLDVYRRLTAMTEPEAIASLRAEVRDRFGALPPEAGAFFMSALLRVLGGRIGIETLSVRGNEARITFRGSAVPAMKGISSAFHEVQFQAEVRRAHPLSLKLTRLGGASVLDGLVHALTLIKPTPTSR
jgi:transcription-repair coupling factor (superfamily II helicase)